MGRGIAETYELLTELIAEWKSGAASEPKPVLLDQKDDRGRRYLRVTWDRWKGLDHEQRSEVVMEAFVAVHGQQAVLNVVVAVGVTTDEDARSYAEDGLCKRGT